MGNLARLSSRISRIDISPTMKVAAEAARRRARGVDIVDLGPGEPDFPTPSNIKQAAIRAIEENFTRYTPAGGIEELRAAVCARHSADFGTGFAPNECVISAGGKHALFNVLQALVDHGDEVIIPTPAWATFQDIVTYSGGTPVLVPTSEQEGFAVTAALIEPHVTERTRAVVLNSPCNPSGAVIPPDEWERILYVAARHNLWLITDECYSHLVYDGVPFSVASLPGARGRVIVIGSLSKIYAMTGWRIGYMLGTPAVAAAVVKLQSQSTSNPNSVAQRAAVEALTGPQDFRSSMLAEYRRRRDLALNLLQQIPGILCHEPAGAFYLYPNVRDLVRESVACDTLQLAEALLERAGLAVVPGEAFGTPGYLRITFAVAAAELERGLERLKWFVAELAR